MKGYLTICLSLSLAILSGFILLLTDAAIQKAEKTRLECAADTSMNALLSEFSVNLYERYGLLYVDASYLGGEPSVSNMEERLWGYLSANTAETAEHSRTPWGWLEAEQVRVSHIETAVAEHGYSLHSQAVVYAEDTGIWSRECEVLGQRDQAQSLDLGQPMEDWSGLMGQIAGMELPTIINKEGELEEVPLSNPADWVFALAGSDPLYLGEVEMQGVGAVEISLSEYLSHRTICNEDARERNYRREMDLFLGYLFEMLGYYGHNRDASLLNCQLEYVVAGQASDWKNLEAVTERIFRWRFADNVGLALSDMGLRQQAEAAAMELHAVQLKDEFREPVTESMLYACAFLESVSDLRTLFSGGQVPLCKSDHHMQMQYLLSGTMYQAESGGGWDYGQYLAVMLTLLGEEELHLRVMDVMEMDIRMLDGNAGFAMDWCVERFEAEIAARSSHGKLYRLKRRYGYF